jgi:hypothetical protein
MLFDIEWYYWALGAFGLFWFILTIRADIRDAKAKEEIAKKFFKDKKN